MKNGITLFNSPLEVGLRVLIILLELSPPARDLDELVTLDYILTHSGDFASGPSSIHPPALHSHAALLVRRKLISNGLRIFERRKLITQEMNSSGFAFVASPLARSFLKYLNSEYSRRAHDVARWMLHRFGTMDRAALASYVGENVGRWGAELDAGIYIDEEVDL